MVIYVKSFQRQYTRASACEISVRNTLLQLMLGFFEKRGGTSFFFRNFAKKREQTMAIEIGKYNVLRIGREVEFGFYLSDETNAEVLLPKRYVTPEMALDQEIEVFVYNDSEGRPVATTERPLAVVGDTALMRVKAVNSVGAFLDWGLVAKDLLVPFREQRIRMMSGRSYIVHVYLDEETQRIVASSKLDKFVSKNMPRYQHRQKVDVLIVQRTDLGYKGMIDNRYWGILYQNELYTDVNVGEHHLGYVKFVREDGKIDVTLSKIEKVRVDNLSDRILQYLNDNSGQMSLTDKSSPEEIAATFSCSKKDFKKALGLLYKQRLVELSPNRVTLCQKQPNRR